MPAAGGGNTRAKQLRRPKVRKPKLVPHGPGGQRLRPAPRQAPVRPRTPAAKRRGVQVVKRAAHPKPPSPRKRALAQERSYRSQGRAVEKDANEQRRAARIRRSIEAIHGDHPMTDAERNRSTPGLHVTPEAYAKLERSRKDESLLQKKRLAPVLTVLDQTTRPIHAVAGGTNAALKGKSVPKAALRGLENKDKTTFSTVLKTAGVKNKTLRSVGGFVADVALDPTTYLTGGTASVARSTAAKAAAGAEKKALAKGLTKEQAARFGERAAKQTARKATAGKGVTVKVAGHEVPGVAKATEKASRPVKAAARKVTPQKVRSGSRHAGADLNPNIAPAGVKPVEHQAAVRATRRARAASSHGIHEAQQRALGIRKQIGEKNYSTVIDALESGNVKSLPAHLHKPTVAIRSHLRYANRQRKQAGIRGGERKNYVPHHLTEDAVKAEGKTGGKAGVGRRVVRPSSSMARKEQRSLKQLRADEPGRYSENLPKLYADRMTEGSQAVARANLNREIAGLGRDVKKATPAELKDGKAGVDLKDGEAVFHVKGSDLPKELTDKEVAHVIEHGGKNGRHVVLNREMVKNAIEGSQPTMQGPGIVRALDKTTAGFKRLAIATPGFHVRNIIGDMQNAYLGQSGHRIPGNLARAGRTLKAYGRHDKALQKLEPTQVGKATLKTGKYGAVTYDEAAKQLREHGAFRSGYIARELPELMKGTEKVGRIKGPHLPQGVKRAALNREDLPRLVTAMEALRRGATWEQAAQAVSDLHFDYQHLTNFERQIMRRAMPFYTWSARNIPLQAKTVVTRPGKYAQFQKAREEAAGASDTKGEADKARGLYADLARAGVRLPKGWEKGLTEWEQRNAGIPISWKGHTFTISTGLPLQDLSEAPGAAGVNQLNEYYQKGLSLTGPIPKDVIEYFSNHSFFFRDQIERDYSPNVAAPGYVGKFPKSLQKKLGVVKIKDKQSGKLVWAWPGKVDYLAKAVPGTPNYAQQLATQGADRRGKTTGGKILGYVGVKSVPYDPVKNAVNLAYARQQEIQKTLSGLRQQGIGRDHPTAEWRHLNDQLKIVNQIAYQGKAAQGFKVLPTQGGPKKVRAGSGGFSSSLDASGGGFKSDGSKSSGSGFQSGG